MFCAIDDLLDLQIAGLSGNLICVCKICYRLISCTALKKDVVMPSSLRTLCLKPKKGVQKCKKRCIGLSVSVQKR